VPQIEPGYLIGFTKAEEKAIIEIVELNSDQFKTQWNEYFSK